MRISYVAFVPFAVSTSKDKINFICLMLKNSDIDLRLALNQLRTENPESEWTWDSLTTY